MNKTFKIAILGSALAFAFSANAAPRFAKQTGTSPSFDNVSVGYVHQDLEDGLPSFDGFAVELEKRLTTNWYAGASFSDVSNKGAFDTLGEGDMGVKSYVVGLGYVIPMSKSTSLDLYAGFAKQSSSAPGVSLSENGYHVALNFRQRVGEVEWQISPSYTDLGDEMTSFAVGMGAEYYLSPNVSLGGGVTVGEDDNTVLVGFSYHF